MYIQLLYVIVFSSYAVLRGNGDVIHINASLVSTDTVDISSAFVTQSIALTVDPTDCLSRFLVPKYPNIYNFTQNDLGRTAISTSTGCQMPEFLALDGDNLYWVDNVSGAKNVCVIYSDGNVKNMGKLDDKEYSVVALAAYDRNIYVIINGKVDVYDTTNDQLKEVATLDEKQEYVKIPGAVLADANGIYVADNYDPKISTIVVFNLDRDYLFKFNLNFQVGPSQLAVDEKTNTLFAGFRKSVVVYNLTANGTKIGEFANLELDATISSIAYCNDMLYTHSYAEGKIIRHCRHPGFDVVTEPPKCYQESGAKASIQNIQNQDTKPTYQWFLPNGTIIADKDYVTIPEYVEYVTLTVKAPCERNITVKIPAQEQLIVNKTGDVCAGTGNGTLSLNATGGTGPYTYFLDTPHGTINSTSGVFPNLENGSYNVSVTDNNGCFFATTDIHVHKSQAFNASLTPTNVVCYGNKNGQINITVVGGSSHFVYIWEGQNTPDNKTTTASKLAPGFYNVTVKDLEYGCTNVFEGVQISQPDELYVLSADAGGETKGEKNGHLTVVVKGGTPPYVCELNGKSVQSKDGVCTFTDLSSQVYPVYITDTNKCTTDKKVEVPEEKKYFTGVSVGAMVGTVIAVIIFFIIIIAVGAYCVKKGKILVANRYGKIEPQQQQQQSSGGGAVQQQQVQQQQIQQHQH